VPSAAHLAPALPDPLAPAAGDVVDDPLEFGRFTRWVSGPAGERHAESALQLAGMRCAACAGIIEGALVALPGVSAASVSHAGERASVTWDPERTRPSALIAAVRRVGYDAVPDLAAPARDLRRREQRQALWRFFVASFCAMQVMMFATPSYVAGPGDLDDEMRTLLNWGSWILSLPVMAFSAMPYFSGAWHSLRGLLARRAGARLSMDVPVALGLIITFVASTGATFDPAGPFGHEVYFDSLTMFVSFLLGARWIELKARGRAAEALERAMSRLPETAWRVAADGSVSAVSTLRLHVGDRVQVPLGQAFPADGTLQEGLTAADESLLSGESAPVAKRPGDALVAGSLNVGAPVRMTVERIGGDTRLEAIVSMMKSALAQRPAAARLADRWATPFLVVVLLLAAGGAAVWSVLDPGRAVWVAVSVLIVTCPCALSMAAPATLVAAARGLARRGVLLQRLDAIEVLATARRVVFDKTGTLTDDQPLLAETTLAPSARPLLPDEAAALVHAAALAAWSRHPLSQALVAAAPAGLRPWAGVVEHPGLGLEGRDESGRLWRLGAPGWAGADADAAGLAGAHMVLGVVADGSARALAGFRVDERLREGAAEGVRMLAADGVALSLLSGDRPERAWALAARLGITEVHAGATPEAKLAHVTGLQSAGDRVVMVGDGVNDAPVLARADASLAMGQGALVARAQADAVIGSNRISDVALARRQAQRALAIVRQNMIWAGAYNATCIPLALMGWLPPWAAGLGMAASSLFVILNAQRAARVPR
jgi:P-type Cu2+ transporter